MCDGEDCCKTIAKILLVIINLFFFLLGLLMLAFGIAMVAAPDKVANAVMSYGDMKDFFSLLGDVNYVIKAAGIFMIVLGGIVALIGGFGFFGACCENRVLLALYLIAIIIILLAEVALIIFAACFTNAFTNVVEDNMSKTLIKNFTQDAQLYPSFKIGSDYEFGYTWAALQFGEGCCGVYSSSDYMSDMRYTYQERMIQYPNMNRTMAMNMPVNYPISCCKLRAGVKFPNISGADDDFVNLRGCLAVWPANSTAGSYNDQGCYTTVYNSFRNSATQVARIAIGIAAAIVGLEIIIIILGFLLCCWLQRSKSLAL